MKVLKSNLRLPLRPAFWTVGIFGASYALKLTSNVVLAHVLSPAIMGVVVLINTVRAGIELLTDVGIEQNIVRDPDGLSSRFFNTAWTMQIVRGALLTAVFLALSPVLAGFYSISVELFAAMALAPFLNSLHSTSIFVLSKKIEVKKRNLFELVADGTTFVFTVALVVAWHTIWAVLLGTLSGLVVRSLLSYSLPHPRHQIVIDREAARRIIHFGKWIALSSILLYVATNIDRIMLGRLAPLTIIGVYGLARIIADLPVALAGRLSHQLVFPSIAAADAVGSLAREKLRRPRLQFVLASSILLGTSAAWADVGVHLLYDKRYAAAGWMLSVLLASSWFSVLSSLQEAVLLGVGQPAYLSVGNVVRVAVLLLAVPAGYGALGVLGAVLAFVLAEALRYLVISIGQKRMGFGFMAQDGLGLAVAIGSTGLWVALRLWLGLGTPWF